MEVKRFMNPFTIGIIIFILSFVLQLLLIIKKEKNLKSDADINEKINIKNQSKKNIKIFGKILIAIILSFFLSIIGFYISAIIFLGTNLSV